ncbi:MAG TPA: SDR family oxidoreductase [Gemmatimonadales bacterium]|nr:SDR family oxidoreductase [Gemmatimonadales bacterium]
MTRRTVVITGASTGIGEACALHFDREGWQVFAGVRREEDGLRLAAQAGARFRWVLLDVTDGAGVATAADAVREAVGDGGLHGLVNNAGIAIGGPLEYLPLEQLRRQFEVNVFGLVGVTQAFLPLLRHGRGRIVNVGSIAGLVTSPMVAPYCASKHAVEALTDGLRLELAPWGLHVAVIEPGVVVTPIWDKGLREMNAAMGAMPPEALERYDSLIRGFRRILAGAARRGVPAAAVVRAVEHALTAPRPKTRYLIGRDARLRLLAQRILPRRWMDRLVWRVIRSAAGS